MPMKNILRFCVISFLLVFICASLVIAVGISPAYEIIDAVPGLEKEIGFYALNPSATGESHVSINLKTTTNPLAQYIFLPEQHYYTFSAGEKQPFTVKIKLPNPLPSNLSPGRNDLWIGVSDIAGSGDGSVAVFTNSYGLIRINVPYPGFSVILSLRTKDVSFGKTSLVSLDIKSQGLDTINTASATVSVLLNGKLIKTLPAKQIRDLHTTESQTITWDLDTQDMEVGEYTLIANVIFGNAQSQETQTVIRIGDDDLEITNFTTSLVEGSIRKFDVQVNSVWNNPLQNIWAEIKVRAGDITLDAIRTSTIESIEPWKSQTLTAYLDTSKLPVGTYDTDLFVHFGSKVKEAKGTLTITPAPVIEKPSASFSVLNLGAMGIMAMILGVLMVLLVGLNIYLLLRKK